MSQPIDEEANQALTSVLDFILGDKHNFMSWLQKQSSSIQPTDALPQFLSLKEKYDRNNIKISDFPPEVQQQLQDLTEKRQKAQQEIDSIQREIQIEVSSPNSLENDRNRRKLERIRDEIKEVSEKFTSEEKELSQLQTRLESIKKEKEASEAKLNEIKEAQAAARQATEVVEEPISVFENKTYEPAYWEDLQSMKALSKTRNAEIFTAQKAGEKVFVKKFSNRRDFEDEVGVIEQLHSGYVLLMYAATLDPQNLFFVSEYKSFNLYTVIRNEQEKIPWDKKWQIACDICHGMWYLHSRSPSVMTREFGLRAYKCFLGSDFRTKISVANLGLPAGIDISEEDLDNQHLPPELLSNPSSDTLYGEKSDVYAFGVILWMMSEQKAFPWTGDAVAKNVLAEERPEIGKDVPEDFAKLIEVSWKMKPEVRQAFKRTGKVFEKKGMMNNRQEESKKAQSKIEELNREMEILKQMLERLEKQHEQAERKFNREKQLTECTEQELAAANARLDIEKKKASELERKIQAANQEMEDARKAASVVEKTYTKKAKEKDMQQKRIQEELEEERDSFEKKFEMERKRGENTRSQLSDAERALDDERYRRTEAEKRRDDYRSRI